MAITASSLFFSFGHRESYEYRTEKKYGNPARTLFVPQASPDNEPIVPLDTDDVTDKAVAVASEIAEALEVIARFAWLTRPP